MESICANPPNGSLFDPDQSSTGSYYSLCGSEEKRIDALWFDNICNNGNHPGLHSGDNRYYEICDNETQVTATWFKNFCDSASPFDVVIDTKYYRDLCQTTAGPVEFEISSSYRQELDDVLYRKSPDFVIWPPEGAVEVSPVFYEEIPDPLPDYEVSGYPLSVQFNPGLYSSVRLRNFTLEVQEEDKNWVEANYRASVSVRSNGVKANNELSKINWSFKTKTVETPLITVNSDDKEVAVPANEWFTIYHIPTKKVSRPMIEVSAEWNRPAKVESEIIDMNTIRMRFRNNRCNEVVLSMKQRSDLILNPCH